MEKRAAAPVTALRLISRASSGTGVTGVLRAGRFTQRKPKLLRDSVGALPDTGIIKLGENLLLSGKAWHGSENAKKIGTTRELWRSLVAEQSMPTGPLHPILLDSRYSVGPVANF